MLCHAHGAGDCSADTSVSVVQTASIASSPFGMEESSVTLPLPTPIGAGNLLAVFVSYADGVTLTSVTDNLGNTFKLVRTVDDMPHSQAATTAYAQNTKAGVDSVTANFNGLTCCRSVIVHELHGADTIAPLDGNSARLQTGAGTGTDSVTSGQMFTQSPRDYIFAASTNSDGVTGQTISAGTGFSRREILTPSAGNSTVSEDENVNAPGSVSSTFTYSNNGASLTMQMAFRP
jgi:hypothetical protein